MFWIEHRCWMVLDRHVGFPNCLFASTSWHVAAEKTDTPWHAWNPFEFPLQLQPPSRDVSLRHPGMLASLWTRSKTARKGPTWCLLCLLLLLFLLLLLLLLLWRFQTNIEWFLISLFRWYHIASQSMLFRNGILLIHGPRTVHGSWESCVPSSSSERCTPCRPCRLWPCTSSVTSGTSAAVAAGTGATGAACAATRRSSSATSSKHNIQSRHRRHRRHRRS